MSIYFYEIVYLNGLLIKLKSCLQFALCLFVAIANALFCQKLYSVYLI